MFITVPLDAIDELIGTISELKASVRSFDDRLHALDAQVSAMFADERQAADGESAH